MNEKLQQFINLVPTIQQMTGANAAICVWNKEAIVEAFFESTTLDIKFDKGWKLQEQSDPILTVLRTGKPAYNKVPKETFGHAFEGSITPIKDGNEIVGVVTYCFSTEEKEAVMKQTEKLTESIHCTDKSINGIMDGTATLATNMLNVQKITDMVKEHVQEASNVVNTIQKNAKYSNILALNASIESARAGQAGKGFAVVSDEMRKFSKMSEEAATQIGENLGAIVKSIDEVRFSVNHSSRIAEEQTVAVKDLNQTFQTVYDTAEAVNEICKDHVVL